jgi:hypothetical protein
VGIAKIAVALLCIPLMDRPVTVGGRTFTIDRSVVDQALAIASVTLGLILGLFVLGSLRRPVRSGAALAGLVVGFVVAGALWLRGAQGQAILAWPWYAPAGTLTTVAVALFVNLFGTPQHAGQLANRGAESRLDTPR